MEKKHVAWFPGTNKILITPDKFLKAIKRNPVLGQIRNQLENDRMKVFTGSLEDRYQIYLENTSEDPPKTFDEWLGI